MESNHLIDFTVDKENKNILVKKVFLAPVEWVWDAWTESALLDQWWAPKPWKAVTKTMDFREGGHWLYCMEGPKGEKTCGKEVYKSINNLKNFEAVDTFCDENGTDNKELPTLYWNTKFNTVDTKTEVTIELKFDSASDLEKILAMGFKEGFEAALGNLEEFLKK